MAHGARGRKGRRRMIGIRRRVEVLHVAPFASRRGAFEDVANVTLPAGSAHVCASQGEPCGGVVIKPRAAPLLGHMAYRTVCWKTCSRVVRTG